MSNQNLLNQTREKLIEALGGISQDNFQLLSRPEFFSRTVAQQGQMNPAIYQIVSQMPDWSDAGNFTSSDKEFYKAYRRVLSHVIWKVSPERQNALNKLKDRYTEAVNSNTEAIRSANQAYINAKQSGGVFFEEQFPTFRDWYNSPSGGSFQKAINDTAVQMNQVQDLINQQLASEVSNDIADAMAALELPTDDPNTSPNPRGWVKVPGGAGDLQFQPEYKVGMTGQELAAKLTDGSVGGFNFQVDASKSVSKSTQSWAKAAASARTLFWEVKVNGSWQKLDIDESDTSLKATFSAESATTVRVNPGDWYDSGLMADLASGANTGFTLEAGHPPFGGLDSGAVFGQFGLLSARVSGLVVAMKPKIEISMSSSSFERHRQKIEASAGFRYGPFQFGGRGGHESDMKKSTANGTTFTIESESTEPLIIGVTVAFPGKDTKDNPAAVSSRKSFVGIKSEKPLTPAYASYGKGLHIYNEGKIRLEVEGRYHFHIEEM